MLHHEQCDVHINNQINSPNLKMALCNLHSFELTPFEEGFLNRVFQPSDYSIWNIAPGEDLKPTPSFRPRCDMYETPEKFLVHAELPGVKKEDLKVEIHQNQLTISGEAKFKKEKTDERRHFSERRYGSFVRTFTLPENANTEDIAAKHEHGVLEIQIPKVVEEKTKAKQITIA